MKITSDPNDPGFRKALRDIGAPDWYPQDAPRHTVNGISEQKEDGTWVSKLVCSICGWETHFESGDNGSMKTIKKGNKWAIHSGSTAPDFQITGLKINSAQDQEYSQSSLSDDDQEIDINTLRPFEDFLGGIEFE